MGGPLARQRNLAYVTPTRAKFGCRVAVSAARTGPHLDFVQAAAGAVRRELELAESAATPDPGLTPDHFGGEQGEVVRYVAERGFGFIACSDREVFFHLSNVFDVRDAEIMPGLPVWFASGSQDGKEARPSWQWFGRPAFRSLRDRTTRRRSWLSQSEIAASASLLPVRGGS